MEKLHFASLIRYTVQSKISEIIHRKAKECDLCGSAEDADIIDTHLPESFKYGVYDNKEVFDDEVLQVHGSLTDSAREKWAVVYDPDLNCKTLRVGE